MNTILAVLLAGAVALAMLWLVRFVNLAAVPLVLLIAVTLIAGLIGSALLLIDGLARGMDG